MPEDSSEGIHERYFSWLYSQMFSVRDLDSPYSYVALCDQMHSTPFQPFVPNDDNRAADGIEIRLSFIKLSPWGITVAERHELMRHEAATIFEVLIGISYRANVMTDADPRTWLMMMLRNLRLHGYTDEAFIPYDQFKIASILRRLNNRTYSWKGRGGLFPLKHPATDQRNVEIWYQMSAYMIENKLY